MSCHSAGSSYTQLILPLVLLFVSFVPAVAASSQSRLLGQETRLRCCHRRPKIAQRRSRSMHTTLLSSVPKTRGSSWTRQRRGPMRWTETPFSPTENVGRTTPCDRQGSQSESIFHVANKGPSASSHLPWPERFLFQVPTVSRNWQQHEQTCASQPRRPIRPGKPPRAWLQSASASPCGRAQLTSFCARKLEQEST
jgi:hypothetical protein